MSVYYFFNDDNNLGIKYMSPSLSGGFFPHPYIDITHPNMYLEFCLEEKNHNDLRNRTNAFSNCKKAIHLRIDLILNQYGLLTLNSKCDFPTKLEIIESVGLLPTLMLKNINDERNLIEHDYKIPDEKRVKEVIDVAELLYLATDSLLEKTPLEVIVGFDTEPLHRIMRLEPQKGELNFFEVTPKKDDVIGLNKEFNTFYLKENLRGMGGNLLPFYEVSDKVNNTIQLSYNNKENWEFIIKQLCCMVKNNRFESAGTIKDHYISSLIHIPLDNSAIESLTVLFEKNIQERLNKKEK